MHVQTAQAAESAVVIQVGGDLYLSDAGLTSLWTPTETAPGECPYPGLDAFGPGQAKWFFGREALTGELLRYLDEMTRGGPGGPLLVVAPSGTGKSSLLGAGLLSALAEGRLPVPGSALWPRVMITPGSHPLQTLRAALATLATVQTAALDTRFVVVIDQLEEMFTLCESETERSEFFDEIGTLAADAGPGAPWWCSACGPTSTRGPPRTRCCASPCSPARWWWGRCRLPRCGRRSSARPAR